MSKYFIKEQEVYNQRIGDVSSEAVAPLGTIARAVDTGDSDNGEGEFIYLKGVASVETGSWVVIGDNQTAVLASANDKGRVAVASGAITADNYGWFQISGKGAARVAAGFATDRVPYLTSTAGTADDAVVAGDEIRGAIALSAIGTPGAGLAEFDLNRPFVADV